MIQARVKKDSKINPVVSCSGIMFFKEDWAIVPDGFEGEAKNNPYLETAKYKVEAKPKPELEVKATPEPEIVATPEAKPDPTASAEVVEGTPNATDEAIKFAGEMRVKLSWVTGTGKNGRILKSDVEAYLTSMNG